MELLGSGPRVGYLLKSRVMDVAEFMENLRRIAQGRLGGRSRLVQELVAARHRDDPLDQSLPAGAGGPVADGRGTLQRGIARRLWITEGTVEKHVRSIMLRMRLPETGRTTAVCSPC